MFYHGSSVPGCCWVAKVWVKYFLIEGICSFGGLFVGLFPFLATFLVMLELLATFLVMLALLATWVPDFVWKLVIALDVLGSGWVLLFFVAGLVSSCASVNFRFKFDPKLGILIERGKNLKFLIHGSLGFTQEQVGFSHIIQYDWIFLDLYLLKVSRSITCNSF